MKNRHVPLLVLVVLGLLLGPLAFAPVSRAGDEQDARPLAERLATTTVSLEIEEMPLAEVVTLLRVQTGLNLLIDPRILSDVAASPVKDYMMADVDLRTVLNLLARSAGEYCEWSLQGDVAVLTARGMAPSRLDTRIYPVADLVLPRRSFVPPPDGLLGRGAHPDGQEAALRYGNADELIEFLRGGVSPPFWEETEGADIRTLDPERLVVTATSEIQEAVLAFLAQLENRGPDALRVELHALDAAALPPEVAGAQTNAPLADAAVRALLAVHGAAVPTCTLAVRDGVASTAFLGTRRAYVSDVVPRRVGGAPTSDPEIEAQALGLAVRVRAVAGEADGRIRLELGVALARPRAAAGPGPAEDPGVGPPDRVREERASTLWLEPRRWHLAEGSTGGTGPATTAFLVRVTPLDFERTGPPAATPFVVPTASRNGERTRLADVEVARVDWEEVDLDEILGWCRTISGLDFYLAPRVRAEVYDDVRVTLHLADVSLQTILDLVTEPYELQWTLEDAVVVVDRRGQRGPDLFVRCYPTQDLTIEIVGGPPVTTVPWRRTEPEPTPRPLYHAEALVDLIRETIGRYDTWEDPAAIEARNGILIARNEPYVLDAVGRFLRGLRDAAGVVVATVDPVVVDDATASALATADPGGGLPWLLDPGQLAAIETAVAAGRATRLGRERVLLVDGASAPRWTGEEIRYVADYDVRSEDVEGGGVTARRVDTLRSGTSIALRAAPGHAGSPVSLEIQYERSVLSRMEPYASPHGGIDLPVTDVWRVATGMRIPDGRTAVASATRVGDVVHLLLVTARRSRAD